MNEKELEAAADTAVAASAAARTLRAKYQWRDVEAPRFWNPKEIGELVGYYGGRTVRKGGYGQDDKTKKRFSLRVAEGEALPAATLPEVQ